MQGGQGEVKHWAFNDPPKREGKYKNAPPTPAEYRKLDDARRRSASDDDRSKTPAPPAAATSRWCRRRPISVGPVETWKAEKVSIWHAGMHDNPFGQRLTALMISKRLPDSRRADVAAGRSSERAVQLLPQGHRDLRDGNALKRPDKERGSVSSNEHDCHEKKSPTPVFVCVHRRLHFHRRLRELPGAAAGSFRNHRARRIRTPCTPSDGGAAACGRRKARRDSVHLCACD